MILIKYIFIVFLFVFNFTVSPLSITSAELVGLVVILAAPMDRGCIKAIFKYIIQTRFFHLCMLLLGLYGILLSIIWGANELIFGVIFAKLFISSLIAFAIVYFLMKDLNKLGLNGERELIFTFFDIFLGACFLQASSVILSFFYPEIRDVFNGIVANRGNIDIAHPFRLRGLHDSGGSNLSVVLGIASLYGIYSSAILERRAFAIRLISSAFIAFALTLVGRTGLLIWIFGFVIMIFFRPFNFFRLKFIFLVLCLFFFGIILNLVFPENFEFFNNSVFGYAFEFFVNYVEGASLTTESSDDLKTMLFIPEGFHLFFGSGSFDDLNAGVERSDSGYVKILLASGLFGFIVFYSQLCVIILWLAQKIATTGIERMFFAFLLGTYLIAEVKEPVFIQNDTSRLFLLVVMTILFLKKIRIRVVDSKSVM